MSTTSPYFAILLFRSSSDASDHRTLYSEDVVLIRASADDEAYQKAEAYGRTLETTYRSAEGGMVSLSFVETVAVMAALYSDLSGDCIDLYSRHFHNLDAYRAFLAPDRD